MGIAFLSTSDLDASLAWNNAGFEGGPCGHCLMLIHEEVDRMKNKRSMIVDIGERTGK